MKTEKKEQLFELLAHFKSHGISHEPKKGLDQVLKFQDIIGGTHANELQILGEKIDGENKRLLIWAASSCLDLEGTLYVIKNVVLAPYRNKLDEELEKQYNEQLDKEMAEIREEVNNARQYVSKINTENRVLRELVETHTKAKEFYKDQYQATQETLNSVLTDMTV